MDRLEGVFSSKKREYLLVILLFFVVAVIFTWPLLAHVHNSVLGGTGDTLLNSWIISWDAKTVFTHPSQLFQGNIIYPSRDVLVYSDIELTMGLLSAPVNYIFRNPILAYNFLVFLGLVFSAFGCYLLVKELTGSRWGGLAAGLFFAFCPYKISKLAHLQIMFSAFLPFAILYLYRYLRRGGRWNLLLFALFFLLQSFTSWYYLIFCSFAVGLFILWTALFSRTRGAWLRLGAVVLALLLAAAVMIPFALPYLDANRRLPDFERSLNETETYSASLSSYRTALPNSLLYGDAPWPLLPGEMGSEFINFPGVIVLLLALVGLLLCWSRRREPSFPGAPPSSTYWRDALFFLLLALAGFILSYGPKVRGVTNIVYMIPYKMGLFKLIRVPSRFYILVALGLAVLAGYGVAMLAAKFGKPNGGWRKGRIAALVLVLILIVDIMSVNHYVNSGLSYSLYSNIPIYGGVPKVYSWLKDQGDAKVIELPTIELGPISNYDRDLFLAPKEPFAYLCREGLLMYFSTYHWKKTANGYSGYTPYFYKRIFTEMQGFPSRRSLDLLRGLGIDYLIWHWRWVPDEMREEYEARLSSTPGLRLVHDYGEEAVFGVEPGGAASPQDMRVELVAPVTMRPGTAVDMGLMVTNTSGNPMVAVDEEPQPFRLRFVAPSGEVVYEEEGHYRAPFFLEPGESQCLPVRSRSPAGAGSYRLEVILEGGVLGTMSFEASVEVAEIPDSFQPGVLEGRVGAPQGAYIEVPEPGGLFPLLLEAENSGDTLWIASSGDNHRDRFEPDELVRLRVLWLRDGEEVWEEQRISLPCDLSPGQRVTVPTLLRSPPSPGEYRVLVSPIREREELFGESLMLDVLIEGGMTEAAGE